jgi:hypothetical protein
MKALITVLTLSIVTATPMLAQAASRHSVQDSRQQLTPSNNVTFEGRNIGTDPDPNVRFELNRNAGYYAGQD